MTFEEGLELVREAKKQLHNLILMANITYAGDDGIDGWVNMAKRFEDVGADIIELNMCCPNMSYNLETTSGGSQTATKQTGASMGQHGDIASGIVAAIKSSISIPVSYTHLDCPASMLRKLPGAALYLDRDSATLAFPESTNE